MFFDGGRQLKITSKGIILGMILIGALNLVRVDEAISSQKYSEKEKDDKKKRKRKNAKHHKLVLMWTPSRYPVPKVYRTMRSTTDNQVPRSHVSDDPLKLVLIPPNLDSCSPGAGNGTAMVKRAWTKLPYIIRIRGEEDILLALLSFMQRIGKEQSTVVFFQHKNYCLDNDISPWGVLFLIGRFEADGLWWI